MKKAKPRGFMDHLIRRGEAFQSWKTEEKEGESIKMGEDGRLLLVDCTLSCLTVVPGCGSKWPVSSSQIDTENG